MAVGCGPKCAKVLLIIFNFIFWLSGGAILGVGIWLRVDKAILKYVELVQVNQEDPMLNYAAYVLIGIGAFVFIVGFFGCCGAIRESKCMLGMYIFFMLVVMAGELAAGIMAVLFKGKVEAKLKDHLKMQIEEKYSANNTIAAAWDFTQVKFACCGAGGYADYRASLWYNETGKAKGWYVPETCCSVEDKDADKPMFKNLNDCRSAASTTATTSSEVLNVKGCYEQLLAWFQDHAVILIGAGIGIACLELFGFIFAICLCRNIGKEEEA